MGTTNLDALALSDGLTLTGALTLAGYNVATDASFSIGAEATNAITVSVQLKDANGDDLNNVGSVQWYLATSATGKTLASAPDGGTAVGTDGALIEVLANLAGFAVSEADGDIDFVLTESTAKSFYLVLIMPTGKQVISGAITFA